MAELLKGTITYINHEKKFATIEYSEGAKKKTITGNISPAAQKKQIEALGKGKQHHFMIGDVISFTAEITPRGDRMHAVGMRFLYNNALDMLINKSKIQNRFVGYLKEVDGSYFVKEAETYLFFKVPLSAWQVKPTERELNEQVDFYLVNTEKKEKIEAALFTNSYIPEYLAAVKHYKAKDIIEANVARITPFGIFLNVIGNAVVSKIPLDDDSATEFAKTAKVGDKVNVRITFLSKSRIVTELINDNTDGSSGK